MTGSTAANGIGPPLDLQQAAAGFRLSSGESLDEASERRPLAIVFLRHFGCTFTRRILRELEALEQSARAHNTELVLVHMLQNGDETGYLAGHGDVARIADPHCDLYRAFGLGKASTLQLYGPRVLALLLVSVVKGCGVGPLAGDGRQLPGAFLFHKGRIIAAQRARSASDLPDLPGLFDAAGQSPSAACSLESA